MTDIANFFNIIGAQALLHIRQASATGMALTQQIGHEWLHSGADKQRSRIIFRHERGRGDNSMSALREEAQE